MKVKILYYPGQIHRGKGLTAGLQKAWHQLYYVPWKTRRHRSAFPKCKTWHRAQCEILNTENRTGSARAVEGFPSLKESGHPTAAAAAAFKMFTRMHILRNCMEFKQFLLHYQLILNSICAQTFWSTLVSFQFAIVVQPLWNWKMAQVCNRNNYRKVRTNQFK